MSVHRDAGAGSGWTFRCDVCERCFTSAGTDRDGAVADAAVSGWVVQTMTLCPACVTAREQL